MYSYPRAILHFDGDSFFASIEQSLNHTLRGKPVVTGGERGAATSLSYEAKARGAYRGMSMREIRRVCPDVQVVASDYTSYSIYARRMYAIVREYTQDVEEYSIDECFAEITGLEEKFGMSYEQIGQTIKDRLENDLGITFGVGLAPNKTLAKAASKAHKPAGFTPLPLERIPEFLSTLPAGSVWGMGGSISLKLEKLGLRTAGEFAARDMHWLMLNKISKPYKEIWNELNGRFIKPLHLHEREDIGSMIKSRTFTPTRDRAVIYSNLARNVEAVCAKARRHHMRARRARFYLKTQDFTYDGILLDLSIPVADPRVVLALIVKEFDRVYVSGVLYRAAGVALYSMTTDDAVTPDLFGASIAVEKDAPVLRAMDALNHRYGGNTVHLASALTALAPTKRKSTLVRRTRFLLEIDQRRKSLDIPYLGVVR